MGVLAVSALLFLLLPWLPASGSEPLPRPVAVLFGLGGAALLAFFVALPRRLGYALTPEGLQVSHFSATEVWPYASLDVVSVGGELGLKQVGVGVPGYYTGTYGWKGPEAKTVQALASTPRGGVLLRRAGKLYYLTPADPAAFVRALEEGA
ncbi:PH domain-containing protein [Deinococcus lacus]|uniref:PH domain-containing protein n=1 Tax=Deinococcus lacus TaxID=392561 RepID=A0ABW1Y9S1_9DEIO